MKDLKAIRFIKGTKVSHDYEGTNIALFSYKELIGLRIPCIGIPCKPNRLVVVDVDVEGPTHKKDGREFWGKFMEENHIPETYTVQTPSGGFHYYFRLPPAVNEETFMPPGELAPGVDVKWRGWVGAPPTEGYEIIHGNVTTIEVAPPTLMMAFAEKSQGKPTREYDGDPSTSLVLHKPFSATQLQEITKKIEWIQVNGDLSRDEWRNGLFALKAGVEDPVLLDDLAVKWTMNRAYNEGDEHEARKIVERADRQGPVGPGSIFSIINSVYLRNGAPAISTPFTTQEIIDRSGVAWTLGKDSTVKLESSESNVAALLGVMFDENQLYHDERQDLFIYNGVSHSDESLVNMFLPLLQSPRHGLGLEKFRKQNVKAGLDVLMAKRRVDPHKKYLHALVWDGTPRLDTFFSVYAGVPDSDYIRIVSKNFWVSLAARGLSPGCKLDSMVILEGHEGIAKSSLVEAIGGEYTHAPSNKNSLHDLDALRQMHQAIIVELPELIGLIHQDSETVKGFLSKPFDHVRDLYAKKAIKKMRGFVLVGTTNAQKYLALAMGVRRFWPIRIPKGQKVDLAKIRCDRDQLFAEAIYHYRNHHPYWDVPKDLLDAQVQTRVSEEPLMGPIREILSALSGDFTVTDLYRRLEASGFLTKGYTATVVDRIESCLIKLGCEMNSDQGPGGHTWTSKVGMLAAFQHPEVRIATLDSLI